MEKLIRAMEAIAAQVPSVATLALVEKAEVETIATDGESIFYNPEFIAGLTDAETRGVLVHEAMHIAVKHEKELKWN